jgi:hypothetical protein
MEQATFSISNQRGFQSPIHASAGKIALSVSPVYVIPAPDKTLVTANITNRGIVLYTGYPVKVGTGLQAEEKLSFC